MFLSEINLKNCNLSEKAIEEFFSLLMKKNNLIIIDLSNNFMTNQNLNHLEEYLYNLKETQSFNLKFLNIENNKFDEDTNYLFMRIFEISHSLFIQNNWKGIDTYLAIMIIERYLYMHRNYILTDYNNVSKYLTDVNFSENNLDDVFCEYLASSLIQYPFLKTIDIRQNNQISSYGLKKLLLSLFSEGFNCSKIERIIIE